MKQKDDNARSSRQVFSAKTAQVPTISEICATVREIIEDSAQEAAARADATPKHLENQESFGYDCGMGLKVSPHMPSRTAITTHTPTTKLKPRPNVASCSEVSFLMIQSSQRRLHKLFDNIDRQHSKLHPEGHVQRPDSVDFRDSMYRFTSGIHCPPSKSSAHPEEGAPLHMNPLLWIKRPECVTGEWPSASNAEAALENVPDFAQVYRLQRYQYLQTYPPKKNMPKTQQKTS